MFFNLSTLPSENWKVSTKITQSLWLNTDDGWETHNVGDSTIILKGYAVECDNYTLAQSKVPKIKGNYCAFIITGNTVDFSTSIDRPFPIWLGKDTLTNCPIYFDNLKSISSDTTLSVDGKFDTVRETRTKLTVSQSKLSHDAVIDKLDSILSSTFETFIKHNTKPLKVYLTGGVDSTLAWTYIDKYTKDYEILDWKFYEATTPTYFSKFFKQHILNNFWGYAKLHQFPEPSMLVSGAHGDGSFLRGGYLLQYMLLHFGESIWDHLSPHHYQYYFFNQQTIKSAIAEADNNFKSLPLLHTQNHLMNWFTSDYQHWHIDNTITFTPFRDIELFQTMLNAPLSTILSQGLDASVSKELITRLDPNKLDSVQRYKNIEDNSISDKEAQFIADLVDENTMEEIISKTRLYYDADDIGNIVDRISKKIQ